MNDPTVLFEWFEVNQGKGLSPKSGSVQNGRQQGVKELCRGSDANELRSSMVAGAWGMQGRGNLGKTGKGVLAQSCRAH